MIFEFGSHGTARDAVFHAPTVLCTTFQVRVVRLKLFGHVARADKSQDHSCALQACISPAPRNWRRRPGRPRHTWLRTVEEDLRQFNLGLASGLRRAQKQNNLADIHRNSNGTDELRLIDWLYIKIYTKSREYTLRAGRVLSQT